MTRFWKKCIRIIALGMALVLSAEFILPTVAEGISETVTATPATPEYTTSRILIELDLELPASESDLITIVGNTAYSNREVIAEGTYICVDISDYSAMGSVLEQLNALPGVISATADEVMTVCINNVSEASVEEDNALEMLMAANGMSSNSAFVVGLLDTGISTEGNYADLVDHIDFTNAYNFVDGNTDVTAIAGEIHGTEVARILSLSDGVSVLPLKVIEGDSCRVSDVVAAIDYAKSQNVRLINCGFSFSDYNITLKNAMENSGIIFVTAVGNNEENGKSYPAGFGLNNVIAVGGVDSANKTMLNNPGNSTTIYTTPKSLEGTYRGNSFAAATAAVTVAMMMQTAPVMDASLIQLAMAEANTITDGVRTLDPVSCVEYALPYSYVQSAEIQKLVALHGKSLNVPVAKILQTRTTIGELTVEERQQLVDHFEIANSDIDVFTSTIGSSQSVISVLYASVTARLLSVNARTFVVPIVVHTIATDAINEIEKWGNIIRALSISDSDAYTIGIMAEDGHPLYKLVGSYLVSRITGDDVVDVTAPFSDDPSGYSSDVQNAVASYYVGGAYINEYFAQSGTTFKDLQNSVSCLLEEYGVSYSNGTVTLFNIATDYMNAFSRYPYSDADSWETEVFDVNKSTGEVGYDYTLASIPNSMLNLSLSFDPQVSYLESTIGPAGSGTTTYYVATATSDYTAIDADELPYYISKGNYYITAKETAGEVVSNLYESVYGLGAGWRLDIPLIETNGQILHMADGSKHEIVSRGGALVLKGLRSGTYSIAVDESGLIVNERLSSICYTDSSHVRYYFDATGRFIKMEDQYGNYMTASYDDVGQLARLIESNGRYIDFIRTSSDTTQSITIKLCTSETSYTLATVQKEKTDVNNVYTLSSVKDALEETTTFEYEFPSCDILANYRSNMAVADKHSVIMAYLSTVTTPMEATYQVAYSKGTKSYGAAGEQEYNRISSVLVNGQTIETFQYKFGFNNFLKNDVAESSYSALDSLLFSRYGRNRLDSGSFYSNNMCAHFFVTIMSAGDRVEKYFHDGFNGREYGTVICNGTTIESKTMIDGYDNWGNPTSIKTFTYGADNTSTQQNESRIYDRYGNTLVTRVDLVYTAGNGIAVTLPQSYTRNTYNYTISKTLPIETITYTGTDADLNTLASVTRQDIDSTYDRVNVVGKYLWEYNDSVPYEILQSATEYYYNNKGQVSGNTTTAQINESTYRAAVIAGTDGDIAEPYKYTNTSFNYDTYGNTVQTITEDIADADGNLYDLVTEQVFDIRGLVTVSKPSYRVDQNGNKLDNYGDAYNTISQYNARGDLIKTIKPDGTVEETVYADNGREVTTKSSGNPDSITIKDSRGRVIETRKQYAGETSSILLSESTYDIYGRVLTQKEYTKDDLSEYTLTTYEYDWQGEEIASISESFGAEDGPEDGQTVTHHTTTYANAVLGNDGNYYNTVEVLDELSGVHTISYNDATDRTVLTVTTTDGETINEFAVMGYYGEVLRQCGDTAMTTDSKTDAEGKETTLQVGTGDNATVQEAEHDGDGEIVVGGTKKAKSYSTYDALGQEIRVETDLMTDADGNPVRSISKFYYDGMGNQVKQMTLLDGDEATGTWATVEYGYDKLGRLVWVDEQENVNTHHYTQYIYDEAGRKTVQLEGLSEKLTITVDYSQTLYYTISNPNSIAVSMTTFTYDKNGNFTSMTTPDGQVESYVYDDAGRLLTKTLANGTQITHTYDEAGNLLETRGTKTVDGVAQSIVLTTTYDDQGRVKEKQDETGTLRYAYDQDGKILAETRIENGKIISQNRYDYSVDGQQERYRLFVCDLTAPAYGAEVDTVYDAYSSDVSLLRQDIAYYYDNQARVIRVVDRVSGSVTRYVYDSEGAIAEKIAAQLVNGVETTISRQAYTYNLAGLATEIRYFSQDATASYKVETLTYRRDGNMTRKVCGDTTIEYAYDALGRLTAEIEYEVGAEIRRDTYTYNCKGDRATKTSTTEEDGTIRTSYYYDADSKLTSEVREQQGAGVSYTLLDTTTYTYDASGNLLTKSVDGTLAETHSYDALNRLSGVVRHTLKELPSLVDAGETTLAQVSTQESRFFYDANAQRIGKSIALSHWEEGETVTDTAHIRHIVNDTAAVYDVITQEGAATRDNSYIFGMKAADGFAQFEALFNGTTLYAGITDAHTDVVELRTVTGTSIGYEYDAFGNELSITATDVYNPYRYTGQYYDTETGLYYVHARYYNPETGRFTQKDTYRGDVHNPQTLSLYVYATNNPVRYLDHFGQMNYLTQTGTLFKGILKGIWDEIASLFNIQGYIDMAKAIFSGQLNLKSMLAGLLDNNYLYILKNLKVLNPFKSASNDQVLEMGKRIGGVVYDIASALVGAAAAKVLSILKATKVGSKIASTLSKAKCKIKTNTIGKITKKTYCFAAGTPVLLVDGMKPIEEVRKGDWVWSTDQGSGELEEKQVEEVFVNETNEIVHVRYGDEDITATTTHPFYTPDRGWVSAVNLRAGDRLQLVNGEYVTVEQVQHEILEIPITVYNFRVADNHTYYVGDGDDIVLVHNASCGAKNPKVKEAALKGIQVHKNWKFGKNVRKEVPIGKGARVDGIDYTKKIVYELKPNNAKAIRKGQKQLERYIEILGDGWTGVVVTY